MRRKTIAIGVVAALVVVVGGVYATFKDDITLLWHAFHVKIAKYPVPNKTVWLDQNVSKDGKDGLSWFYHADQGTRTFGIPYEWFMALEQPTISWLLFPSVDPFNDPAYLDRYGFIPDKILDKQAPLPIGFAHGGSMLDPSGEPWREPRYKKDMTGIGLTCAACHTGRFTYNGTEVVIDGGPALTDLLKLKQGIGVALFLTRFVPGRFSRFAEQILGSGSTVEDREALKYQLDQVLNQYKNVKDLEERVAGRSIIRRLRTAGCAEPDRQSGVFHRPEESGQLCRILGAGALPPDLEHAVVRLGAE